MHSSARGLMTPSQTVTLPSVDCVLLWPPRQNQCR
jgi:hypothetical protein